MKLAKVAALLAIGLPALLIGPVVMSSMCWFIAARFHHYLPWTYAFYITFLVLTPLLFWTEWRTGGNYYTTTLGEVGDASSAVLLPLHGLGAAGALVQFARNPRQSVAPFIEIFLWGPRQVLEAAVALRGVYATRSADRSVAADVLQSLLSTESADVKTILRIDPRLRSIAIVYLAWYGWASLSKDQSRIWINSHAKAKIARA